MRTSLLILTFDFQRQGYIKFQDKPRAGEGTGFEMALEAHRTEIEAPTINIFDVHMHLP